MKRQHPYNPKCQCQRCKAVKRFVTVTGRLSMPTIQNIPAKK